MDEKDLRQQPSKDRSMNVPTTKLTARFLSKMLRGSRSANGKSTASMNDSSALSYRFLDCTRRTYIVLDTFLGNVATAIASQRTRWACYRIKFEPRNIDAIVRRWHAYSTYFVILASSGRSSSDIEKEENCGRRN